MDESVSGLDSSAPRTVGLLFIVFVGCVPGKKGGEYDGDSKSMIVP